MWRAGANGRHEFADRRAVWEIENDLRGAERVGIGRKEEHLQTQRRLRGAKGRTP
jgi:hypothetical protein